MITKELVDRINELARKQRSAGLTDDEKAEQAQLRAVYLAKIRAQVVDALESAGYKPKAGHGSSCGCPNCGSKH